MNGNNPHTHLATTVLRWGLAFVFLYSAFAGLFYSKVALIYFPSQIVASTQGNPGILLTSVAAFEIFLAAWLFWGRKADIAASIAFLALLVSLIANIFQFELVFQNVGLALSALALFFLVRKPEL